MYRKRVSSKTEFLVLEEHLFFWCRDEVWIDDLETGKGHLTLEFRDICVFTLQFARDPNKDGQQLW